MYCIHLNDKRLINIQIKEEEGEEEKSAPTSCRTNRRSNHKIPSLNHIGDTSYYAPFYYRSTIKLLFEGEVE